MRGPVHVVLVDPFSLLNEFGSAMERSLTGLEAIEERLADAGSGEVEAGQVQRHVYESWALLAATREAVARAFDAFRQGEAIFYERRIPGQFRVYRSEA